MSQIEHSIEQEYEEAQASHNDTPMENFNIETLRRSSRKSHFCYYSLLMIPIIILGLLFVMIFMLFTGIQSQQNSIQDISKSITEIKNHNEKQAQDDFSKNKDTMSDMMKSFKDKQEHDINEIKDAIGNISISIMEMKNKSEKQQDDFSKNKDTIKDISQSIKNMSDLQDRIYKKSGLLRTGPKRYILSTDTATFLDAFQKCQDKNIALASIDSEEEYNSLITYIKYVGVKGYWYWTSGTRKDASSEFYWKSSGKPLSYTKWRPGDPDNTNCISIMDYKNNTVMSNYRCDRTDRYICEYRE